MNVLNFVLSASKVVCPLATPRYSFHKTPITNRWYKHHFVGKKVFTPPQNPYNPNYDWENVPYKPKDQSTVMESARCVSDFDSLSDSTKQMFTNRYMDKKTELNEQINDKMRELGFHPAESSTATAIVRMTIQLRYKKWLLEQCPRDARLRSSVRCLIKARWRTLRLLRCTNLPEFQRLQSALCITGFRHPDPFDIPIDALHGRKKVVRNECYQMRLAKLVKLKTTFMISEKQFEQTKHTQLSALLKDLTTLIPSENEQTRKVEAEKLLRQLFAEVVDERRAKTLVEPEKDLLIWYENEAKMREEYQAKEAKKLEQQLRKARR